MLKISNGRTLPKLLNNRNRLCGKRFFLSQAFRCEEAWENRLKAPVFQKIQLGNLFAGLEKQFAFKQRVSVLDVDIFMNGATDNFYINEMERVLLKLRSEPETSIMLESTAHAALRLFFAERKNGILNLLSQRLEFGLFPDTYFSIFMIDSFLKENDCLSAIKIAVLEMLQEDCNHPILRSLSLYSCLKYLNSSLIWESPEQMTSDGNDDDDELVRVPFLRNEFFDDHFDILNTNHLLGKTMYAFGKTVEGPLGISNQLIGLILYEKYMEAKNLIRSIIRNKNPVFKEAIEKAEEYLQTMPKQAVENNDKNEETPEKLDSSQEKPDPPQEKLMLSLLLNQFTNENVLDGSLEDELKKLVEEEVKNHEESYITKQCEKYKMWEKKRLENIESELLESQRQEIISQVAKIKAELAEEEKKIFYFDLADEFAVQLEKIEEKKQNIKYFKEKRKKVAVYDTYVPPKV